MKEILKRNIFCDLCLSIQKYDEGKNYRFLHYVIDYPYNNGFLLFNTLTKHMYFLDMDEYESINKFENNDIFAELLSNYFIVPVDFDDEVFYNQIFSFLKNFEKTTDSYTHFTIFPTMECNARCFYCFEHGAKCKSMSNYTAIDVAEYIIKKSNGEKVSVQWFGGEPLFNESVIDIISNKLIENEIAFESRMISNGYLFTDENIVKAKEKWNLKSVQITLDGTEEIYNRVKAYIYKTDDSPFLRVLTNIEKLLTNNIRVWIRLNLDKHNQDDLYTLIDILYVRFNQYADMLSVYVWPLYNTRFKDDKKRSYQEKNSLFRELFSVEKYIREKGFELKSKLRNDIKFSACIADHDNAITILPDGKIGKCDHYSDEKFVGSIYSDYIDENVISEFKEKYHPIELCKRCPARPICKRLKNCPEINECDKLEQKHYILQVKNKMRNTYDAYNKNGEIAL